MSRLFRTSSVALCAGLALLLGCDRPPSDSAAREWTAEDHDRVEENAKLRSRTQASAQPRGTPEEEARTLVELTWSQRCASCHGVIGRGDGPSGPMVKAPDLTRAEWQSRVTDGEIAGTIRNGKNQMPKFDLPDVVVNGLVARIRSTKGAGAAEGPR